MNVSLSRIKGMQRYLRIPNATLESMDKPEKLAWRAQQAGFRYVLNIEGHGGWADRLYQLLLSPMLVIAQDLPSRLWYEGVLSPGVTHLAVDSNLRNLSEAVRWANAHRQVLAMVAAANEAMEAATSVAGSASMCASCCASTARASATARGRTRAPSSSDARPPARPSAARCPSHTTASSDGSTARRAASSSPAAAGAPRTRCTRRPSF